MIAKQALFKIGLLAYFVLMLLALFFYEERTLWGDIAFHLFYIIKDGSFAIQNGRFGSFFTQSAPLIASQLGCSIQVITLIYSLVFILLYAGVFLLAFKVFKQPKIGLSMLLLSTLMVSDTFFWIQSELPQGLAILLLFFAWICKSPQLSDFKTWEFVPLAALLTTIVYVHPLILIPFAFIIAFLYLNKTPLVDKKLWIATLVFFVFVFILKQSILKAPSAYEDKALERLSNFYTLFPDFFTLDYNVIFFKLVLKKYYFLVILLGLMSYRYYQQKLHWKMALMWSFFFGYLILINVVQTNMPLVPFYLENLYLPLSIFVILPFVFDFLPTCSSKQQQIWIGAIVLVGMIRIGFSSTSFSHRIQWQKDLLASTEQYAQKKLVVPQELVPKEVLMENAWSSPYEFWLLSSIQNPKNIRSIIIHPNPKELKYTTFNRRFITYWGKFEYKKLEPAYYFNFQDTSYYNLYHIPEQ